MPVSGCCGLIDVIELVSPGWVSPLRLAVSSECPTLDEGTLTWGGLSAVETMRPIPWKASCQDEDQDQIQNSNLEKAARDKDSWPTRLALPLLLAPTQILTYGQQGIP